MFNITLIDYMSIKNITRLIIGLLFVINIITIMQMVHIKSFNMKPILTINALIICVLAIGHQLQKQ